MHKIVIVIFIILCGVCSKINAQSTDSVYIHVDSALNILKTYSLYSKNVNWSKVYRDVHAATQKCKTKSKAFDALKIAFESLGDKHATFYHYNNEFKLSNKDLTDRYSESLLAEWKKGPKIIAQMVARNAYLRIPFIGARSDDDVRNVVEIIQSKIKVLLKEKPEHWIIDLRLNAGGNIRPMLAGLSSFFPDGILGCYLDRNGKVQEEMRLKNGNLYIDNEPPIIVGNKIPEQSNTYIALLIGPGTGSSGEILANFFKHRKKTILVGERTAGMANSTQGFVFDNQNAYYLISVSSLGDKDHKLLPQEVEPNLIIKGNDHFTDLASDLVMIEAEKWLNNLNSHDDRY